MFQPPIAPEVAATAPVKLPEVAVIAPVIATSPFAATDFISSNKSATFASKNRETHIGFGGEEGDTAPQWLGYVNSMIFDKDVSKSLYLDEDTIHTYDDSGVTSLSKICVA